MELEALGLKITGVQDVNQAASALDKLAGSTDKAKSATGGLGDSSRKAAKDLDAAKKSSDGAARSVDALAGAARMAGGIFVAAFSVASLKNYADAWSNMQSNVGSAIGDMSRAADTMQRVVDIANASYSPLEQTVAVFSRNVATFKDLGRSAAQAADFTEAMNHALVTTATRGQDADVVINSLSRALATGGLNAMDFDTIVSRSPRVLQAMADKLGVTVSAMRAMASEGKVTSDVIAQGLIDSLEKLREEAGEMPATVGDAFTRVNTNFTAFIGALDKTSSASATASQGIIGFADAIGSLAKNQETIDRLIAAAEILLVVMGSRMVAAGFSAAASMAMVQINAMRAAGGITAMGLAARGASGAMALLGGPVGIAITALGLGALAWSKYGQSARDNAGEGVLGLVDAKGGVDDLVAGFEKLNKLQQERTLAIKQEDLAKATKEASKAVFDLGNTFQPAMDKGTRAAAQYRADFTRDIKAVQQDTTLSADEMANKLADVVRGYIDSGRASEGSRDKLLQMAQAAVGAASDVNRLNGELHALAGAQTAVAETADPAAANMRKWQANLANFMKQYATPDERLKAAVAEQKELLGELYSPDVEARLRKSILPKASKGARGETQAQKDAKAAADFVDRLKEQVFQLQHRTAVEQLNFDIQQKGLKLTGAQFALAESLATKVDDKAKAELATAALIDRQNTAYQVQERLLLAQQQYAQDLGAYGKGDRAAKEAAQRIAIQQKQDKDLRDMAQQHGQEMRAAESEQQKLHLQSMYEERLAITQQGYEQETALFEQNLINKREKEAEWQLGFEESLQNFVDRSENIYALAAEQTAGLLNSAQQSISTNFMSMLDGTKSVGDAFSDMAAGMGRAVVQALVDMAAQWLVYQGVQLLVGKTTQASGAAALTANAYATAMQAGLAAFASTAAIPIVGPALAPAAMAAALGIATPMATAVSGLALAGMAHDGIDSVPREGTWLLDKGERVTTANTSAKLDSVLERIDARQRGGYADGGAAVMEAPKVIVNLMGAPEGTQVSQRRTEDGEFIIDVMMQDLKNGGRYSTAQSSVFGTQRRGS